MIGSVIRNYKIMKILLLGGGGGNVYVAKNLATNENVVLKSSVVKEEKRKKFEDVNKAWKSLSNSCVIKFIDSFYEDRVAFIVMEYCEKGDLNNLIQERKQKNVKFTEYEVATILTDICTGVKAIHSMKIIHRDLKPANVLIGEDSHCKIADFDVSRLINEDIPQSMTWGGTIPYLSPEALENKFTFSSDMYGIGAILYEVLALAPAFTIVGLDVKSIRKNEYLRLDPTTLGYSAEICHLASKMLSLDPMQRPSPEAVLADPAIVLARVRGEELERHRREEKERKKARAKIDFRVAVEDAMSRAMFINCFHCHIPVFKNDNGNNQIRCTQCGHDFCYACGGNFSSTEHFSEQGGTCPSRYTANDIQNRVKQKGRESGENFLQAHREWANDEFRELLALLLRRRDELN